MIKKEFYKFKEAYIVFLFLMVGFLLYLGFSLKSVVQSQGNVGVNLSFVLQKQFLFYHLSELNLVFAFCIGIFVFIRERIYARLRLTLHFPNSILCNISYIILVGLVFVIAAYAVQIAIFNVIFGEIYETEIMKVLNFKLTLNFAFGCVVYLFCAGFIIEPIKRRATLNFAMLLGFVYLYYEINPEIYALDSFYYNEFGFFYLSVAAIYAVLTLVTAFDDYKKGYIK